MVDSAGADRFFGLRLRVRVVIRPPVPIARGYRAHVDEPRHTSLERRLQQSTRSLGIDGEVRCRLRFAGRRREVDHEIAAAKSSPIRVRFREISGDEFSPVARLELPQSAHQATDAAARRLQRAQYPAADEAGAAGDRELHQILPGTGRGTAEGGGGGPPNLQASAVGPHHHDAARRGPPPRSGADFKGATTGILRWLRLALQPKKRGVR